MNLKEIDRKNRAYTNDSKILCKEFSTDKLMSILDTSYSTARRLKRENTDLRKPEKVLLELILKKRVIPNHWPSDITFEDDGTLHGSIYNVNWGQIEHFSWVCEQWGATQHHVESLKQYINETIGEMTPIQQREVMNLRMQMIENAESNQPYNINDPSQAGKITPPSKTELLKQKNPNIYSKKLCQQFSLIKLKAILDVSASTARRLKRGSSELSKPQYQLLELILDKRIMPEKWPKNITFEHDGHLHSGKHNISWAQIEQFSWICQKWHETTGHVASLNQYINGIISSMDEAERVKAMDLRQAIIQKVFLETPYETLQLA